MPSPTRPATTEEDLVDALAAWADVEALPLLRRLGAQQARALAVLLRNPPPAAESLGRLRASCESQSRPDPARIHPSWFVRALREESPAVQRAVLAESSGPLRDGLMRALNFGPEDLAPDHPAHPEAVGRALTLWTERLVGDLPPRDDDPPAIRALTTLRPVALYRLFRICGLAKRSIASDAGDEDLRPGDAGRISGLRERLGGPIDPRLAKLAANERAAIEPGSRHRLADYGLATIGRLLASADAYRVRWALQHVPYPIAKRLRIAASRPEAAVRAVRELEGRLLDAAWAVLAEEGWLA